MALALAAMMAMARMTKSKMAMTEMMAIGMAMTRKQTGYQ